MAVSSKKRKNGKIVGYNPEKNNEVLSNGFFFIMSFLSRMR